MSRSKVVPTSSARSAPAAKEDSLFEPSSLTDSEDSNEKENIRKPKLSTQHLRKLVQYNRKILSPNTNSNDFGVTTSGSSESTEDEPPIKKPLYPLSKPKMTKRSKIRANVLRGRLGEQTFSSRAKITPSLHLLRSEPKKRPVKKPLRKDPKKILKSKLIDEDSINLERSIKHLESGLNELNKNTSYRLSLSTLGSDKRRISSGTVGSLSSIHSDPKRKSLGNRISVSPISPSYSDTESSPLNKKSGLGINRRLSLVQHRVDLLEKGTLSHVQSIDDRVLDIEKRLKVIDMEQVKTRKEQTRTKERLDHVELEIGTQFKKQLEDIQLLTKTLEMVQNKQKEMSQSVKNYDKKQQDLDQVQVMLETKLHHHHEKMREFTERLEELSIKSREIAGNNHALREHLRLLPKESASANWSRSHEAAAMHREETSANKIAAHKQTLRHLQEAQQQLVEERAARPPSKSSTPESKNNSSDELYKRYKNLKHAYYRVFGTAKR